MSSPAVNEEIVFATCQDLSMLYFCGYSEMCNHPSAHAQLSILYLGVGCVSPSLTVKFRQDKTYQLMQGEKHPVGCFESHTYCQALVPVP